MTHAEEHAMYRNTKPAWCKYMAPRWRDIFIRHPERKRAMWADASPMLRAAMQELKETA